MGPFSPASVWRLKFKSNATFKQMPVQEIKTSNPCNAWHQEKCTVWHLEVIFSSSVLVTDKMNLASSEELHINPHHTNSIRCSRSTSNTVFGTFIQAPPTQYNPPPNTQTWLRHCQTWHCRLPCCQGPSLGVAVDWLPGCTLSLTALTVPPRRGFDDRNYSPTAGPSHPSCPSVI